ncbi:MAG TPA: DNA-3-methyladenine glycosylase 2 family protein [Phaeodactylibacter sp.]|nr:DNA-3-methyladenine glycosylase 2 family protein [Phaeodactylibacter sp.]
MKKAILHLSKDPHLKDIISEVTLGANFRDDPNPYHSLMRAIVFQQLSGKAAATIHRRFLALYNGRHPSPKQLLKTEIEALRSVGLSRQKATYLQNIAQFWLNHNLDNHPWDESSDEELIALLSQIKGVGTWTVQMLLIFTLNRIDVFPIDDLGIQKAIVKKYRLRSTGKRLKERMMQIAQPWSPYRSIACRYLWKWLGS